MSRKRQPRHKRLATTPPRIARNSPPGMKPTENKSALRRALLFWQNRSLFESHVQAIHKHTVVASVSRRKP